MDAKKIFFFSLLYICLGQFGVAQIVDIPLSEIKFRKGGAAAKLESHCYQLTDNQNWTSGAIWYPTQINLEENFEMEVELFFGCSDEGADGIVFIFSPKLRVGYAGEGMGFSGLVPSLGVEFDTYQNYHLQDPSEDHIALLRNGIIHHQFDLKGPIGLSTNLEDCKNHKVKVIWKANKKELLVFLDGYKIINFQKNIIAEVFDNKPEVYWGFTSATGGKRNQHKVCFEKLIFEEIPRINTFTKSEIANLLSGETAVLKNVLFESGSANLKKGATGELKKLVTILKDNPSYNISIYGHTDSIGNDEKNKILSKKRAEAIVNFLINSGIPSNRLTAKGMGEAYPIAPNDDILGRKKNRRIEIYLYKPIP